MVIVKSVSVDNNTHNGNGVVINIEAVSFDPDDYVLLKNALINKENVWLVTESIDRQDKTSKNELAEIIKKLEL